MVGYGDPVPFKEIARACGISNLVKILPDVNPSVLGDILADCDVAVSNSLRYALPSKIFEYINNGVHVVSVDDGNDVNTLCAEFVELYDGTIYGMAAALRKVALGRGSKDLERGGSFRRNFGPSLQCRCFHRCNWRNAEPL